jgi:hypothetical protein
MRAADGHGYIRYVDDWIGAGKVEDMSYMPLL